MSSEVRVPAPEPRAARPDDAGVTLVEILVAVVLMGLLLVGLMSAVQVSVRSSSVAFTGAQVETVLLNASDRVARAPQLCDYEAYVDAAALAEGWQPTETSVVVEEFLPGSGASAGTWQVLAKGCNKDFNPFDVQRLTITATDPSGQITRTLTVVKSDVG